MTAAFEQFQRELTVGTRAGFLTARSRGRTGGRLRTTDEEKIRLAEAMLRDTENYPFVNDVSTQLVIGRIAFYPRPARENPGAQATLRPK